jgi:APA family basic amino acid/polyamine antiporter
VSFQTATAPPRELPRTLGLLDSTNIVVGTMIGSAIFLVPHTIAQNIQSAPMTLVLWLLAGVLSMFGALAYAELGAMMPSSGGLYVYIREAWGPLWGFVCGWTLFLVARSGATAAVAAGFSIYFAQLVPMSAAASRWVAAILIFALTLVSYCGVRLGATVQNVFTGLKLLGLLVLMCSTIVGGGHALSQPPVRPQELSLAQFGTAMLVCVFAYNGWLAIGLVGGEIKDPQRNLPRAIILGVGAVTFVYVLVNIGYLRTLTIAEMASTERVAEAAATRTMGSVGATFVVLTILASTFGTTNSTVMTGPRLTFAQARDGLFFRPFGNIHPAFQTPHISILVWGIWSAILALTGSYVQLVAYSTFMFWILYGMSVAGLIVLRRTRPDAPRPYRMFGYPVTPALFIGLSGGVVIFGFISAPLTSTIGVAILLAGIPAYHLWRRWAHA